MAAIDLGDVTNVPYLYTKASVGTTWQEFKLPPWCCRVTVVASKAAWAGPMQAPFLSRLKPELRR